MEHRIIKLSPFKLEEKDNAKVKNTRLSTLPDSLPYMKTNRQKIFRPSCQADLTSVFHKMPNQQKSQALRKIDSFKKRISILNQSHEVGRALISSRQKENIAVQLRKKFKEPNIPKPSNLKPAGKMMLEFQRELARIKKAQNKIMVDQVRDNKDRYEAYSAMLCQPHSAENEDSIKLMEGLYILCDGHGSNGKEVSKFVCDNVFEKCLEKKKQGTVTKKTVAEIFELVQQELEFSGVDIAFSGTTCLLVIYADREIIVANLGDSQAYMKKECKIEPLCTPHVPTLPAERSRIQSASGIIRQLEICKGKFSGPMRIWAPGKNSWGPGISLSRCFGNKAARRYGLISEPEIASFEGVEDDHTIVVGSKALFSQMKIETIFNLLKKGGFENKQQACDSLVQEALKKNESEAEKASIILIFG